MPLVLPVILSCLREVLISMTIERDSLYLPCKLLRYNSLLKELYSYFTIKSRLTVKLLFSIELLLYSVRDLVSSFLDSSFLMI